MPSHDQPPGAMPPPPKPPRPIRESQMDYEPSQAAARPRGHGKQAVARGTSVEESGSDYSSQEPMAEGSTTRERAPARAATHGDLIESYARYLARAEPHEDAGTQYTQAEIDANDLEIDGEELGLDLEDIVQLPGEDLEGYQIYSTLTSILEEEGYDPLIKAAFEAEKKSGSRFGAELADFEPFWFDELSVTLCSMPQEAIPYIITGSLTKAVFANPSLQAILDEYRVQAEDHPSVYLREFADKQGNLIKISDANRIRKALRAYVAPQTGFADETANENWHEAMYKFDKEFDDDWQRDWTFSGRRKRLESSPGRRSQKREKCLQIFIDALARQITAAEAAGTTEIRLVYVGYATKVGRRQRQHEACGSSSNWLATLVQSVCNVHLKGIYMMYFYPVCLLVEESQGFIAEAFLTRIASAYYHTGCGFCIDIAGKSMISLQMSKMSPEKRVDRWSEYHDWVRQNTEMDNIYPVQTKLREKNNIKRDAQKLEELTAQNTAKRLRLQQMADKLDAAEKAAASRPDLGGKEQELLDRILAKGRAKRERIRRLLEK